MLGEDLVRAGQVTPEEVQEAISWQVLYGGRLGTNLMELGIVSEEMLARALGRQYGIESHCGDIFVDEILAQKIPKALADKAEMIPFRQEKKRVEVLCTDPRNVRALDEISFALGAAVAAVVVPQHRIWRLLRRIYKIKRPMRSLDFKTPPLRPRPGQIAAAAKAKQDEAVEMISEEEFNFLYQGLYEKQKTGPVPAAVPAPAPVPGPIPVPVAAAEEIVEGEIIEDAELVEEIEIVEAELEPAPDLSPLTFAAATEMLKTVTNRDEIARVVLRYAISVGKRAALLAVQGPLAIGWDALGDTLADDAAERIALPLSVPSAFNLAVRTKAHYLGPFRKEPGNLQFLKCMGRAFGVPRSILIMPILHNRRVSHLLYLDGGKGAEAPTDVGEILILAQKITRSYDELIKARTTRAGEVESAMDILSAAAPASRGPGRN